MAEFSDPFCDSSELNHARFPPDSTTQLFNSLIFMRPQNPLNPFLLSPLSLSDCDLTSSHSESQSCDFDLDLDLDLDFDTKVEAFRCDYLEEEEDDDQVSFISNLFHRSSDNYSNSGSSLELGLDLGLGLGDDPNCRASGESEVDLELGLGLGSDVAPSSQPTEEVTQTHRYEGLRVVSVDSDTDSDVGISYDFDEIDNGFAGVTDFDRPPFCWDYLGFNSNRSSNSENQQNHEREIEPSSIDTDDDDDDEANVNVFFFGGSHRDGFDDDDDCIETSTRLDTERERELSEVSVLFDAYRERDEQEIMIQSDTDGEIDFRVEEAVRDLEWEILLAVNNFNREVYDMDFNVDMYEAILGEIEEHMNEWQGSPPAAESVIENLPVVCLSMEGSKEENGDVVVCAICKEEILGEEVVRQLPCSHYYHGDCILPWLKIRNTCPVCRHELPTDDPEYEYRKREREGLTLIADDGGGDMSLDSQVSYDFHVFL